jgi:hypothetical protein
MTILEKLGALFRRKQLSTLKDMAEFLESRAAYLAQKSLAEYTQARANMMFSTLLREKGFRDSYEDARWKAYPAALSMVAEMMAGQLRNRSNLEVTQAENIAASLSKNVIEKLRGHGPLSSDDWNTAFIDLQKDLARAGLAAPLAAHAVAQHRAKDVFDALPFHKAIRQHDFPMFRSTLAFHLTEIAAELEGMTLSSAAFGTRD